MRLPEWLKQFDSAADNRLAMIDDRLLDHWQRESAARARLRDSLPASWRDDPRPNMDVVRELYIEAMLRLKDSHVHPMAIGDDDR
ncbi:MAG: hypothetical protein ACJ752_15655 [Gaiellaceae bacterium]|jgi:hypothetical protein